MVKEEAGHYRCGIYHCRKLAGSRWWEVTVEDGKGLPFIPLKMDSLKAFRSWVGA